MDKQQGRPNEGALTGIIYNNDAHQNANIKCGNYNIQELKTRTISVCKR
jgi:hypothetical protein